MASTTITYISKWCHGLLKWHYLETGLNYYWWWHQLRTSLWTSNAKLSQRKQIQKRFSKCRSWMILSFKKNWKKENENLWHQYILRSMLADASICTYHAHFLEKTALVFNSNCYKQWWTQLNCLLIDKEAGISLFSKNINLLKKLRKYIVMWSCGINPFLLLYLMMPASM